LLFPAKDKCVKYKSSSLGFESREKNSLTFLFLEFWLCQELKIVFEDKHIIVVDKPAGVLCVPGKGGGGSLVQAVYDAVGCEMENMDMMVVHRLGMDTSGLVVFAKTMVGMREMNTLFRTREVSRKYEALVCGHVKDDYGVIDMPLMRCLLHPPFMRVSTKMAQCYINTLDLTSNDIGKKYLELPKYSLTEYKVLAREELDGHPVTRVELYSISGRTHQLNVHLAAFGHPIVGDTTYGIDGETEPNGGLSDEELALFPENSNRVSSDTERAIMKAAKGRGMLVHAKSITFRHPTDKRIGISLSSDAPF
jgi:RluA family pseudouridine synthase